MRSIFRCAVSMTAIVLALTACVGKDSLSSTPAWLQPATGKAAEMIVAPLRDEIIRRADADLGKTPITITSFSCERSHGGPHDFYSEADYRWPDPANPGGPYIPRDGESNPDNFYAHRKALNAMSILVANLTSAWILTGDRNYADAVLPHLQAWFINPDTRMNPHLSYAQAIPNLIEGRSYGIIDSIHLIEVVQSMIRLEQAGLMPEDLLSGTKQWFHDYVEWLTTHSNGVAEFHAGNNHGVCWIMQVGEFAKYAEWQEIVEYCKVRFKYKFIPEMAPDGSFPYELDRTKPYGYSLFNLDAMAGVCQILSTSDDDLWTYTSRNGNNMSKALAFMLPYIRDKEKWFKEPDVMFYDQWPVAQPALLFSWYRFRGDRGFDARTCYQTWLELDHFPSNGEVIRNLPLRNPVIWLL